MIANNPVAWSERAAAGTSYEAAMWSERGQQDRFNSVLYALNPDPGESLLDFGCGTGALFERVSYLTYVGYDWSDGMVARAQHDHPTGVFTTWFPSKNADIIACVGPFNLKHNWSKTRTWETLGQLWERCNRAMAVTLYAGTDENCLVYRPSECAELAERQKVRRFTVTRHLPNDLLLLMER